MECISYVNNHTALTKGIPFPLQRMRMMEYGSKNLLHPKYEHCELLTMPHFPIFFDLLEMSKNIDLILFSIAALPERPELRKRALDMVLDNRIRLHFANEDFFVQDAETMQKLDKLIEYV